MAAHCDNVRSLTEVFLAAKNASPIETGTKLHALAHSEGEGGAGAEVEV